jgi:hypothetical protein
MWAGTRTRIARSAAITRLVVPFTCAHARSRVLLTCTRPTQVELRKFKRGEQYTKHRKTGDDGDAMHTAPEQQDARMTVLIETIKTTMDGATMLSAVSECRRIFAQSAKPPVQQFIDSGVLPLTVNLLRTTDDPLMQMEVAWVLTNVCAGTTQQTDAAVKAGAVVELVRLLHCLHPDPRDQAIWALANIAGDGPAHRNEVGRVQSSAKPSLTPGLGAACRSHGDFPASGAERGVACSEAGSDMGHLQPLPVQQPAAANRDSTDGAASPQVHPGDQPRL